MPLAGDSHQHAATLFMIERQALDPPTPGFGLYLHENGSTADALAALRAGGYDWGSVSNHDTTHPRQAGERLHRAGEREVPVVGRAR